MDAAEKKRKDLEDNVTKLRESLRHWQTWEAEYEGLKEELVSFSTPGTQSDTVGNIRSRPVNTLTPLRHLLPRSTKAHC